MWEIKYWFLEFKLGSLIQLCVLITAILVFFPTLSIFFSFLLPCYFLSLSPLPFFSIHSFCYFLFFHSFSLSPYFALSLSCAFKKKSFFHLSLSFLNLNHFLPSYLLSLFFFFCFLFSSSFSPNHFSITLLKSLILYFAILLHSLDLASFIDHGKMATSTLCPSLCLWTNCIKVYSIDLQGTWDGVGF